MEYMALIGEKTNATIIHGTNAIEKYALCAHFSPKTIENIRGVKIDIIKIGKQDNFHSKEYVFKTTILSVPAYLAILAL